VVLLDAALPGMGALSTTIELTQGPRRAKVIILASFVTEETVQDAVAAGASAYLRKNISAVELAEAIRAAHTSPSIH
jgi:DNA-binding NarL/FixJ family response regulator